MKLTTVFFDIGGTIETFQSSPELRKKRTPLFRDCLQHAGIVLRITDDELFRKINDGLADYQRWNRQSLVELSPNEIWSKYVFREDRIPDLQLEPIAEELCFLFETEYFARVIRPEVPLVLHEIQRMGLRIGCISNTLSITQVPHTLERYGILSAFDPIILSSQFGHRKPDPSIFYHAARKLCQPTGSMVYVGDKINRDTLGATRAGFRLAIKISHKFDDGDADLGAEPHAYINSLTELLPILEETMQADKRFFTPEFERRKIKAIFFDAGNILYHKPRKGRNIKRFIARNHLKAAVDVRLEKRKLKELTFQGVIDRQDYYEGIIRLYDVTDPVLLAEGAEALQKDATTVEIMPGVPATMHALKKRGYILGIISDTATPIHVKMDWFAKGGFGTVFDSFISSKELGTRKPAALIYEEASKRVGLQISDAVFVGHKASELRGAREFGLKTIAFNYDKNAKADRYIERFEDLLDVDILTT